MKIKPRLILTVIFLLTLTFRLYISFTNSSFSGDNSYFNLRITEEIANDGKPVFYDELSYGGRNIIYPQAFNYFLSLFSFIPNYEKIIPALLSSLIVFLFYAISKKITNNVQSSLFVSLISAFIPIEIMTTINQISVYSLVIPVLLLMILCLLNLDNKKYFVLFIILSFLLPLIHPISLLFVFSLFFYLMLLSTESVSLDRAKKETIIFSLFVILLINFFLYRDALLRYGLDIIWQNIPASLFETYFKSLNIFEIFYFIGIIPLILGIVGMYTGLFKKKDPVALLLTSFILSTLLLMSLKLINLQIGVLFISIPLVILASSSMSNAYSYLPLTKFSKYKPYFNIIFLILIIVLSVIPSILIANSLPSYDKEMKTFSWFRENTRENAVILVPYQYGNSITYFSKRTNVADDNFLLAPNVEERLNDIEVIYKSVFELKAIELIKKYDIDYIYSSKDVLDYYNITKIPYIDNEECFNLVTEDVYEIKC